MKIVQINPYCGIGSTGKICLSISKKLDKLNVENYILYTQSNSNYKNAINYNINRGYTLFESLKSKILGNNGFNNNLITKQLIKELNMIKPDIIHLHNLHAQNCNLKLLTEYLVQKQIKVVWTFHDCWLLTGNCMYFDLYNCLGWQNGCEYCKHKNNHVWLFDKTSRNWENKKNIANQLDCHIVTPSIWLSNNVKKSFWYDHKISVINNGVNLEVFKQYDIDFFADIHKKGKKIILGVADLWDERKGLNTFIKLSEMLNENYKIVLVGTTDKIDKLLPKEIMSIHHTQNQIELAQIYSSSDIFVNPTIDEVFGLVNIESLACGTPVITFDSGGSPECIDNNTGIVVEKNNIQALLYAIYKIDTIKSINKLNCINRARRFNEELLYDKYIDLYYQINKDGGQK